MRPVKNKLWSIKINRYVIVDAKKIFIIWVKKILSRILIFFCEMKSIKNAVKVIDMEEASDGPPISKNVIRIKLKIKFISTPIIDEINGILPFLFA